MPADADRIKSLFLQAIDLPAGQRPAFVAAVADPDERAELHRLVLAHQSPDARLDQTDPHPSGDVGQVVADRYKLLERIGEGGMGTVWMAEQRTPVKRLVALKLIRPGLDSRTVLARFEAERQALAVMDHPNIARVLDAGETADGRPFFVMELVKGVPITRFCDEARLTPRQRLELFVPVCQAIQHAHQKGVIHRDIKPGNVLVALYDGRPVPKVIDFGVAKAAGQPLTEKTLHTGYGAVVGTPEYMSPEQASFNQLDIDTRSDVYSLGVLLYELLTGGPPFGGKELQSAGLLEMLRVVREQEPPRPSVKLSSSDRLAGLAAVRGTEPARLAGLVRGEVDWIVMKALEKDRNRRYETATGLAADVQRHLSGEPVQAVPPSAGYRLRKWGRKHRGPVAAAAVVLAALVMGVVGTTWQAVRAEREARRARAAEAEEVEQRRATESTLDGLAVDLDLAEVQRTFFEEHGPLPLVRRHAALQSHSTRLREFVTAAVLVWGQEHAPLLPPFVRDGWEVESVHGDPSGRGVLLLGKDGTAKLCDRRTASVIAALQEASERVTWCGYSPNGEYACTADREGVVRFWSASGALLAKTQANPNLCDAGQDPKVPPVLMAIGAAVLRAGTISNPRYDLYDAATGTKLVRLNRHGHSLTSLGVSPDGQWLFGVEDRSDAVIFAANSGSEVARLQHPDRDIRAIAISPSRRRILTGAERSRDRLDDWTLWDSVTWKRLLTPSFSKSDISINEQIRLIDDSIVEFRRNSAPYGAYLLHSPERMISNFESVTPVPGGKLLLIGENRVLDRSTLRRHKLPAGRRFPPAVANLAIDGRFLFVGSIIVDTVTEKKFDTYSDFTVRPLFVSGTGSIWGNHSVSLLPTNNCLGIASAPLELWVQVAVCGELDPDGEFVKWDEPTWQHKWQQLAAMPPPYPDFPFPGHLARDPLHWLRKEYEAAADAAKPPLARELLRRSEAAGDAPEAARWRRELRRLVPEVAPRPRPAVQ